MTMADRFDVFPADEAADKLADIGAWIGQQAEEMLSFNDDIEVIDGPHGPGCYCDQTDAAFYGAVRSLAETYEALRQMPEGSEHARSALFFAELSLGQIVDILANL